MQKQQDNKKQKRLMLLGGLRYLLPVIEAAHKQGYYVITCDYLPDNIAHKYSDHYCNVSIIDQEAVLQAAKDLHIDGIMSFAVDPGVTTAAYVQEQMHLPAFGPYESVRILQNKDLFRAFLAAHDFNVPAARSYTSIQAALADLSWFNFPVIVKPTDSAGSKGVTRVDTPADLEPALHHAFANSISGAIIIEDYITQQGCSSDTDCFSIDGQLVFVSFSAQRFDHDAANEYTPAAYSWPSTFTPEQENELHSELQRLITLLGMKTTIYNVETRIGTDGHPYIMEVSPRGGGNRLSEILRYATGTDLITASVRAAVGDPIPVLDQPTYNGHWAEIILHASSDGFFDHVTISPDVQPKVIELDLWVQPGDPVSAFTGANNAIGTLVVRFDTHEELTTHMTNITQWLHITLQPEK